MNLSRIDENTFPDIFDGYFEPICKFLNLYTKDENVIEDVMQEIFCQLWINRDFLQINHLKSYLYTAARNRMLNHIRNEKLHLRLLSDFLLEERTLQESYECVNREEFDQKLTQAIEDLPEKCRHIFKLSRYSKMSYKKIAEQEGISEKMVEKHISTALRKIREKVQGVMFILL